MSHAKNHTAAVEDAYARGGRPHPNLIRQILDTVHAYEISVAPAENGTYFRRRYTVRLAGDIVPTVLLTKTSVKRYAAYADKCISYLKYGKEIDDVIKGNYSRTDAVKICDTPSVYIQAGFPPLPMLYTQRHLKEALKEKHFDHPRRHGLTVPQIKRLPELLENPAMLFDSPSREDVLLSVLAETDSDGLPLMAVIKPNGNGFYEMGKTETNFILSVYGKNNFYRYFNGLIEDKKLIYIGKDPELNALVKLRLLQSHITEPDLYNTIIRKPQCLNNTQAQTQKGKAKCLLMQPSSGQSSKHPKRITRRAEKRLPR